MSTSFVNIENAQDNCFKLTDENLNEYMKEVFSYPTLSFEDEKRLTKELKEGNKEAKDRLIKSNLKLVVMIAKKIVHKSSLPMTDLIQEGNIGLMVALEKFNRQFGYRFSTYAAWWIKQAIFKAISEQSHSMKIPVYIQETLSKYSKVKQEMEQKTNKTVTVQEVAKKMRIEAEKIDRFLNAYTKTLSLEADYELSGNSEVKLIDVIEDKRTTAQGQAEYEALQNDIRTMINFLKEREQAVITFRFGLGEGKKHTLEEIGKMFGVTKECIRQTETRALKKLRSTEIGNMLYQAYLC
ncbi:RNA polymerase sigma factor RpoD/SigA [bacterium]|nr:RNA polymerase sigma factor RpoD/SigA [bacterium]